MVSGSQDVANGEKLGPWEEIAVIELVEVAAVEIQGIYNFFKKN